jgi:osmotically-inducible protein OsmY
MLIGAAACMGPAVVPRDDAAITNDVRARLAADAQTKPFAIAVDTNAGKVHVAGDVANDAERNSVARIAGETPGVRSVDNDVRYGSVPAPVTP